MRSLAQNDRIHVDRMIGVYAGKRTYRFGDLDILPVEDFLKQLHQGDVF